MKLFLLAFLVFSSVTAFCHELKMAVIASEFDEDVTHFYLVVNNANVIDSIRWIKFNPSGQVMRDATATAAQVIEEGIVLEERNGFEAVRLEVENFNVENGGTIRLNYLFSGVTGARKIQRLLLKKIENIFILTDLAGQRVNRLFLVANRSRIFGIIGIKEILTSWSDTENLSNFEKTTHHELF